MISKLFRIFILTIPFISVLGIYCCIITYIKPKRFHLYFRIWIGFLGVLLVLLARVSLYFYYNRIFPTPFLFFEAMISYFKYLPANIATEWLIIAVCLVTGEIGFFIAGRPIPIFRKFVNQMLGPNGQMFFRISSGLILICLFFIIIVYLPKLGKNPFKVDLRQLNGPIALPWKSFKPDVDYHGQWLVAGDLDGDGKAEILSARHHEQSVTTVLVSKLDGRKLWTWGKPGSGYQGLWSDVPVQIYDIDGDGKQEVWLSSEKSIIVLRGTDGREVRRFPLPDGLSVADCITFADLRGLGRARDIIVKDRYQHIWAYTDDWKLLWQWKPKRGMTSHHPTPVDINEDGHDEVLVGYTMLSATGKELWTAKSLINMYKGHVDSSKIVRLGKRPEDARLVITYCASNGIALLDGNGKTLWERSGFHYQSVEVGRMRKDSTALQLVVDYDLPFGKTGVQMLSENGKLLGTYECDYARHHRLLDWNGDGLQEIIIGHTMRICDGQGKCIARLGPNSAFRDVQYEQKGNDPGPFVVVADVDGDERPEIILYSVNDVMIYKSEKAAKKPGVRVGTPINFSLY